MKRDDAVIFLLGKLDGLRFPPYRFHYEGIEHFGYSQQAIEEILWLRGKLLEAYDDAAKKAKELTDGA